VSDGGQESGGSGFDWGLRPSGAGDEPEELEAEAPDSPAPDPFSFAPPAPEPVAPNPVAPDPFSFGAPAAEPPAPGPVPPEPFAPWESGATQLMPQTEPSPFEAQLFATEASPPPTELLGSDPIASGEPDSALDALFGETGEMPLEDPDDIIILDKDGNLFLTLSCHGSAGTYPNELDSLCKALDGLVDGGGAVEIVDHDTSAGNEDAIGVRFVGADDKQRIFARLDYGFGLAKDWLVDVIGPGDLEDLVATARTSAVKRFGER